MSWFSRYVPGSASRLFLSPSLGHAPGLRHTYAYEEVRIVVEGGSGIGDEAEKRTTIYGLRMFSEWLLVLPL